MLHYVSVEFAEFSPGIDPTLLLSCLNVGPSSDFALLGNRNKKREEMLVRSRWHWGLNRCLEGGGEGRWKG